MLLPFEGTWPPRKLRQLEGLIGQWTDEAHARGVTCLTPETGCLVSDTGATATRLRRKQSLCTMISRLGTRLNVQPVSNTPSCMFASYTSSTSFDGLQNAQVGRDKNIKAKRT